jgi:hypothetical protein
VSAALEFQSEGEEGVQIAEGADGGEQNPLSGWRIGLVAVGIHLISVSGKVVFFGFAVGTTEHKV